MLKTYSGIINQCFSTNLMLGLRLKNVEIGQHLEPKVEVSSLLSQLL